MTSALPNPFQPGGFIILKSERGPCLAADPTNGAVVMSATASPMAVAASWQIADANQSVTYNGQTLAGVYLVVLDGNLTARLLSGDPATQQVTLVASPTPNGGMVWFPAPVANGGHYCLACSPGPGASSPVWLVSQAGDDLFMPSLSPHSAVNPGGLTTDSLWRAEPSPFVTPP